jgi:DNA-binding beta-propeller fold protein YncE
MPPRANNQGRRVIFRRRFLALAVVSGLVAAGVVGGMALADPDAFSGGDRVASAPHPPRGSGPLLTAIARTPTNVYSHTMTGMLTAVARRAPYLVYAPDSEGDGVYVIDPRSQRVLRYIQTGAVVQHVVPAWDQHMLYATNDEGDSLTPIDPNTGKRAGPNISVTDPYNMYFTPDGRHAIVVEERLHTLAFRDPHTFALQRAIDVHCAGVDHLDFSADGSFAVASCEFSGQMVRINLRTQAVTGYLNVGGSPQDVKLSPDGTIFYVANRFLQSANSSGLQMVNAKTFRLVGFIRTADDAHGLYVSRDTRRLYATVRAGGEIVVIDFATRRIVAVWHVAGTPDMGNLSPDGGTLWLSSRYTSSVLAISTRTGKVIGSVPAGVAPHGVCVWPQPGRYSTGHTGVMR